MPRVNIYLTDNTGAEYTGDEQVIFIPGSIAIKEGQADDHKCVYIPASKASKASEYLEMESLDSLQAAITAAQAAITAANSKISAADSEESKTAAEAERETAEAAEEDAEEALTDFRKNQLPCLALIESYLSMNYDVIYCNAADLSDVDFLLDKDSYNVKFLTAGLFGCIKTTFIPKDDEDSDSKNSISFDFGNLNILTKIAAKRKDCLVMADIKYDAALCKAFKVTGDVLADCFKVACNLTTQETQNVNAVEGEVTIAVSEALERNLTETVGVFEGMTRFASALFPNIITTITTSKGKMENITVPAGYAYLAALAECRKNNQYWLPVANSARGQVPELIGKPDLTVTKYHLDNSIILDSDAITFNGIVKIRPYGNVIWGDRTLLPLDEKGIKASVYLSLMLAVCDISKEAYKASVRSTYESNNEVTWLNYKSGIAELLDQMVSAGILQSYDLNKVTATDYNKIICKITLYPNLPVENFDVYINLENAELQLENA